MCRSADQFSIIALAREHQRIEDRNNEALFGLSTVYGIRSRMRRCDCTAMYGGKSGRYVDREFTYK